MIPTKLSCGVSVLRFVIFIALSVSLFHPAHATSSIDSQPQLAHHNKPLRIAVAANFTPVLKALLVEFTEQTGIQCQVMSSASGTIFLQIKHGAPFDIFLSADSQRPAQLEVDGFTLNNSRKTYAMGQLALYSSASDRISLTELSADITTEKNMKTALLQQLTPPPTRFAIANPDIAPYGKAAKEVLEHLGLWKRYQNRLIQGINIGQTFTQVRSKAVSDGLISFSQLILNNLSGTLIPITFHQPIEQQLVILRASKRQQQAKQLSDFLLSEHSQNQIVRYGYAPIIPTDIIDSESVNEGASKSKKSNQDD